ncbi:MAG: molybdopterin-synthase adenylyltransferase MoeB [Gammaproteobacteria bacterium]|nr:molybdopterin-synthase adenylyltransferase MoeB [Gammaproteobacteria bacterium]
MTLSEAEYERYTPHLLLPQIGVTGQEKLLRSKVLIVGMGGLGSPVSLYLAAAGIGTLGLMDYDTVAVSNLQRQVLYRLSDVGKRKAEVAKEKLAEVNPDIHIHTYCEWLTADNAKDVLSPYDFIVDATDNFNTRYLLNDACLLLNKMMIHGSVFQFEGQVSVFGGRGQPCYRCVYPNSHHPKAIPNCTEGGVLGMLPGIIGMVQAVEVIKLILGLGESLCGRLLLYDGLTAKWQELQVSKNKTCPACRDPLAISLKKEYSALCRTRAEGRGHNSPSCREEVTVHELKQALDNNKESILIIDVREPHEYQLGCMPNAVFIPMSRFPTHLHSIINHSEKQIVVACQFGVRSQKAVQFLCDKGFKNVRSLKGGVHAWFSFK